jgi:lysophospholipase L1-like esterase
MKSYRERLVPQMLQYDDFDHRAETNWTPYLMYFQRPEYRSKVINTDRLGFRISHGAEEYASVGGRLPAGPVRLIAGSSTAFGIGATSDAATISSRLWSRYAPSAPWLNFSGRSHNSAQELILYLLHHDLLPPIEHIVIFSGLNDIALAQLPSEQRGEHGAFFFCGEYFDKMEELRAQYRNSKSRSGVHQSEKRAPAAAVPKPPLPDLIETAVRNTSRHLEGWRRLSAPTGARITFVLQPLANWWQERSNDQEQLLFDELELISAAGPFSKNYATIATREARAQYADALSSACSKQAVEFLDFNDVMSRAASPSDWLYVDRAHFNDNGYDLSARLLAEALQLR